MAAPHAFLDILAQPQVRDAYLAGRASLILSADMDVILWANGAGARFAGRSSVAQALAARGGPERASRAQIRAGLASGQAFALRWAEGEAAQSFLAGSITLAPWGEVVFLRSAAAVAGSGGQVDLTDGLSDETSGAALLDLRGQVMAGEIDSAVLAERGLRPLLAEAFADGKVKKRFLGGAEPYPVGVLRLSREPAVLLMIAARKEGQAAEQEEEGQQEETRAAPAALSAEEAEAFAAVGGSLRRALGEPAAETEPAAPEPEPAEPAVQNAQLNFLLNAVSETVLLLDKTGSVVSANAAAARLFGFAQAEMAGKKAEALFAPQAAAALRAELAEAEQKAQSGQEPFIAAGREAEARGQSGNALRLRVNFGALPQGGGYFLLARDMTRFHDIIAGLLHKNAEEAERGARAARNLALLGHEIRTPLSALLGMAQFIAEERAGPLENSKYRDYLADIRGAGAHILSLANAVLDGEAGSADFLRADKQAFAPSPLLAEMLSLITPQANAANIVIRSALPAALPNVLGDMRAARQILLNLLGNAVHFTPPGGQILVAAQEAEGRVVLRVSDTGIGMDKETLARARQGESARQEGQGGAAQEAAALAAFRQRRQGAGLGLQMAYALAEANGLRLTLASEPGKGTHAALSFPLAPKTEPRGEGQAEKEPKESERAG